MKNETDTETEKTIYYISRGFVILAVQEELFKWQYLAFFRAYLVTIKVI